MRRIKIISDGDYHHGTEVIDLDTGERIDNVTSIEIKITDSRVDAIIGFQKVELKLDSLAVEEKE